MAAPPDPSVPLEFVRMVNDKRLIDAIKWLRARGNLDLKSAKDQLDVYLATGKLPDSGNGPQRAGGLDPMQAGLVEDDKRRRRRRLLTWMVVSDVLLLGGVAYYFLVLR